MLKVTSNTFQKRRLELEVSYGKKICVSRTENTARTLYDHFKETKGIEIHMDFNLSVCAICELPWKAGDFAKEKLLLIPKQSNQKDPTQVSVKVIVPRVVCLLCSKMLSVEDQVQRKESAVVHSLSTAWEMMMLNSAENKIQASSTPPSKSVKSEKASSSNFFVSGVSRFPPVRSHKASEIQQQNSITEHKKPGKGENSSSKTESTVFFSSSSTESFKTMLEQEGFLTCTQLVKTGGADQAGLKVGDIFTEFGHMRKDNFVGLKAVANFVRGSANKTFQAIVLRKVSENNQRKKRGCVFHKVRLHLTPLHCQDADGGGVLGAIMNLWPLPEAKQ